MSTGQTRLRVLVVENEVLLRLAAEQMLARLGHDVVARANRASTAIAEARRTQPDLVLMDIQLDGTRDGIEAAGTIRDQLDIPSLFVTGSTDASYRQRATSTNPLGFLDKPLAPDLLRSILTEFAAEIAPNGAEGPGRYARSQSSAPLTQGLVAPATALRVANSVTE